METARPVVVIKVGTSSLINTATGAVQVSTLSRLAESAIRLYEKGYYVILVSSGAVGLGCARLGLKGRPTSIAGKQAAAAVGQVRLMSLYDDLFSVLGHRCAQVLLTYDTFGERAQYLNARNTFLELLRLGVIPIVNENDTVAVQEIRVGDNDTLSALVAAMVGAQWLFLLTDVDALYDANPRESPTASPIHTVATHHIQVLRKQMAAGAPKLGVADTPTPTPVPTPAPSAGSVGSGASTPGRGASRSGGGAGSQWGTGGMVTKLKAAQLATAAGVAVVVTATAKLEQLDAIMNGLVATAAPPVLPAGAASASSPSAGKPPTPHHALFSDLRLGTTFIPAPRPIKGRKRWILSLCPTGALVLDAGAVAAVADARKSLFPAGVVAVEGEFEAQDAVHLLSEDGTEVARALVNYNADDCRKMHGRKSKEIATALGYLGAETLADRDNIVILHGNEERVANGIESGVAAGASVPVLLRTG